MKTSDFPWFPLFVRDWMTSESVNAMSFEERGIFVHFLCLAWISKDCTIPANDITLACMIGKLPPELGRALDCFPLHPKRPDRRWNKRLMKEWEKIKKRSVQATQAVEHRWATVKNRPKRQRSPARTPQPTVQSLLEELRTSTLYTHINLEREITKAEGWIKDHPGRKFTKSFVIHWLNKIEPVIVNGHAVNSLHCSLCNKDYKDEAAKKTHDFAYHPKFVG